MGRRSRMNPQARRIRRKRNFLMHFMFYLFMCTFFFLMNAFTYNHMDGWWFMFPIIGYGVVVFIHYIFSIGKGHMESLAIRWEENEQGHKLGISSLDELDEDEQMELEDYREISYMKHRSVRDDDFV